MERLAGDNQYYCNLCERKADAHKGLNIREFPPILMLCLSRFEFDYNTMMNCKVNDKIGFGLELDISPFAEKPDSFESEDDKIYELCGVFIHAGTAYGGHHRIYLRDVLDDKEKKADLNEELNIKENAVISEKIEGEEVKETGQESAKYTKITTETTAFDEAEYPFPFKNQGLRYGWYEFNDAKVRPITISDVANQFGGKSESAYLLAYRRRSLVKNIPKQTEWPSYLKTEIEAQNLAFQKDRIAYYEAMNYIECFFFEPKDVDVNYCVGFCH